jgi:phosphatidylglycerophosphate synthase
MMPVLARFRDAYEQWTLPLGRVCWRLGISPDALSVTSLGLGAMSAVVLAYNQLTLGLLLILLVGLTDVLDGATARASGVDSASGMVLDHTFDRYVEFMVVLGLTFGPGVDPRWALFALFGMVMASYVRARAEATGVVESCNVGLAGRQEKLALLIVGLLIQPWLPGLNVMQWAVIAAGVISHITAVQRLLYARQADAARHSARARPSEVEA